MDGGTLHEVTELDTATITAVVQDNSTPEAICRILRNGVLCESDFVVTWEHAEYGTKGYIDSENLSSFVIVGIDIPQLGFTFNNDNESLTRVVPTFNSQKFSISYIRPVTKGETYFEKYFAISLNGDGTLKFLPEKALPKISVFQRVLKLGGVPSTDAIRVARFIGCKISKPKIALNPGSSNPLVYKVDISYKDCEF